MSPNRLISFQKLVPDIFLGGKDDWCVVLTTSLTSFFDCIEFNLLETKEVVVGKCKCMCAAHFLQSSGSKIWPYDPREGHVKFLKGHSKS